MMILKHHHVVFLTLNDSFETICTIHWLVTGENSSPVIDTAHPASLVYNYITLVPWPAPFH